MNFIVCCCVRCCEKLDRCASGTVVFKPATEDNLMHLIYDYISLAVAVFFAGFPFAHLITYYNISYPSCS